jgi:pimeloyl-ACP methyl ester carboxylesterase
VDAVTDIGGVSFWYAAHGRGDALVYLHGGFSDAGELDPVLDRYVEHFHVYTPERRGHGHTPDTPGPYDFEQAAADTAGFLETIVEGPADLVGYSDGATAALHVALRRPDLVRRLVLISGQFSHDGLLPVFGDDPVAAAAEMAAHGLGARHAQLSPDGAEHFPVVAEKVVRMALTEPTLTVEDLAGVRARTLVVCSDDDVVSLEHTLALYRGLPDAELAVVPGTSHVLVVEKPELVTTLVLDFLTTAPVPTIWPARRAPA